MAVSYKRLWKKLIDKDLKKKDLIELAHISTYTVAKLNRGDNVTTDILGRICKALNCNIEDIVEFIGEADDDALNAKESAITDNKTDYKA